MVRGTLANVSEAREGPFWEAMDGRRPAPRIAQTLGFEFRSWNSESEQLEVAFAGELHDGSGTLLATASATVRILRGAWQPG